MKTNKVADYSLLTCYLSESNLDEVFLSFEELSKIILYLPEYAYNNGTPWYTVGPIGKAALTAGYKANVSRAKKVVTFYKVESGNHSSYHNRTSNKKIREDIPYPTENIVNHYLNEWSKLENYVAQESALESLFQRIAPLNTSLDLVLIKVTTLNEFYSTRIPFKFIYSVAQHIVNLNIDDRLMIGDDTLVRDVANTAGRFEYSFATKYCSHHNAEMFPIYDNYVNRLLCHYRDANGFAQFFNYNLKDYPKFKKVINEFRKFYSFGKFSIKEVDRFLWLLGKEKFPNENKG